MPGKRAGWQERGFSESCIRILDNATFDSKIKV